MSKTGLIGALFAVLVICLIAWSTIRGPRYRAQVCMTFKGNSACKTVSSKSEEAAVRAGIEGACADLVSGVTETFACGQSQPTSLKWLSRP